MTKARTKTVHNKRAEKTPLGKLESIIAKYRGQRGTIIPVLQEAQEALGFLSPDTIEQISRSLEISSSQVYGVATFYSQFRLKPVGRHICKICHGTACHVSGATEISEAIVDELHTAEGETTTDGQFTIDTVACLGCCSLAPVIMIDQETYGRLTPDRARKILKEF